MFLFLFGLLPFFFPVDIFVIVFVFAFLFFQSTFLLFLSFFFSSPHFCCCYCFVVGFVFVFFFFSSPHCISLLQDISIYIYIYMCVCVCCRLDHEYVARGYFFHKGRMKVMVSKIYRVSYPTFCCIFYEKEKKKG